MGTAADMVATSTLTLQLMLDHLHDRIVLNMQQTLDAVRAEVSELWGITETTEQRLEVTESAINVNEGEIIYATENLAVTREYMEDIDNTQRRHNIRLRGVANSMTNISSFAADLFKSLLPDETVQVDYVFRLQYKTKNPHMPRDILVRLPLVSQREALLKAARKMNLTKFKGTKVQLYADLSPSTLEKRKAMRPLVIWLQENAMKYRWLFPFAITFEFKGWIYQFPTLEEARRVLLVDHGISLSTDTTAIPTKKQVVVQTPRASPTYSTPSTDASLEQDLPSAASQDFSGAPSSNSNTTSADVMPPSAENGLENANPSGANEPEMSGLPQINSTPSSADNIPPYEENGLVKSDLSGIHSIPTPAEYMHPSGDNNLEKSGLLHINGTPSSAGFIPTSGEIGQEMSDFPEIHYTIISAEYMPLSGYNNLEKSGLQQINSTPSSAGFITTSGENDQEISGFPEIHYTTISAEFMPRSGDNNLQKSGLLQINSTPSSAGFIPTSGENNLDKSSFSYIHYTPTSAEYMPPSGEDNLEKSELPEINPTPTSADFLLHSAENNLEKSGLPERNHIPLSVDFLPHYGENVLDEFSSPETNSVSSPTDNMSTFGENGLEKASASETNSSSSPTDCMASNGENDPEMSGTPETKGDSLSCCEGVAEA